MEGREDRKEGDTRKRMSEKGITVRNGKLHEEPEGKT